MPERPLLLFPTPQNADRAALPSGRSKIQFPDASRQGARLTPQFKELQETFKKRALELQSTTTGIDPEQALVLETIDSVDGFIKAVKHIPGLEWMGEVDIEEFAPDEDFFDIKKPGKSLSGRLYMIMTNQKALEQMLSIWKKYQKNPDMKFVRGTTSFRDVFLHLKTIRRWDIQDRFETTGIIDVWREKVQYDEGQPIRFEIELWYRSDIVKQAKAYSIVEQHIQNLGGKVIDSSIHKGIAYHGVLAELPASAIQNIIDKHVGGQDVELVKCDSIMFFRPTGQAIFESGAKKHLAKSTVLGDRSLPHGEPVIALLDGLPLSNHQLLADRLVIDDPDDFAQYYQAGERNHGTAMASLIIHGDLEGNVAPLDSPLYVTPIMHPIQSDTIVPRREYVPESMLFVDILHRAVRRLFEKTEANDPVAPSVRIINLSIGDPCRQFFHSMSPAAKMLDYLSATYNVLFIVSAGNQQESILIAKGKREFESLSPADQDKAVIESLFLDSQNRRILSPAENINGIAAGSLQQDSTDFTGNSGIFNPFSQILPSPVSPIGSGYRKAIKPDMLLPGGVVPFREDINRSPANDYAIKIAEPSYRSRPPGNLTAMPSSQAGVLDGSLYSCGTSNAAALLSHAAGIFYTGLRQIIDDQEQDFGIQSYETPLLKAMLAHGCTWGEIGSQLATLVRDIDSKDQKKQIRKWMGYGIPQIDRVLECTERRATLLGFGQLVDKKAHLFNLPLPPSLASLGVWRRLTVTLAWLSQIYPNTQKYRAVNLWFDVNNNRLADQRQEACGGTSGRHSVKRGTLQHEIFDGRQAEPFTDGAAIEIKVNCRADAGKITAPVSYGLIVTLEVGDEAKIAVYDEIRARIATAVQIRQTVNPDNE